MREKSSTWVGGERVMARFRAPLFENGSKFENCENLGLCSSLVWGLSPEVEPWLAERLKPLSRRILRRTASAAHCRNRQSTLGAAAVHLFNVFTAVVLTLQGVRPICNRERTQIKRVTRYVQIHTYRLFFLLALFFLAWAPHLCLFVAIGRLARRSSEFVPNGIKVVCSTRHTPRLQKLQKLSLYDNMLSGVKVSVCACFSRVLSFGFALLSSPTPRRGGFLFFSARLDSRSCKRYPQTSSYEQAKSSPLPWP